MARPESDIVLHKNSMWDFKSQPLSVATATPASVTRIGGIEAPRVLSVIASAFIANHLEESTPDTDDESPFLMSIDDASDNATGSASTVSSALRLSAIASTTEVARAQIRTCDPGSFICEAHGLRPMYFACDSVGMALPASCAVNEVCYQYGQSILCDAPGGNLISQHKYQAMA
ncbi:hypothetical protein GGI21_001537 [Coemansia aciculifera]|nr:hypothetical protein GGI21_001537 [Coemansia aciculifera]